MLFSFDYVVADVVHKVHVKLFRVLLEDLLKCLPDSVGYNLSVGPGKVGCTCHRPQIVLSLLRCDRSSCELPVRKHQIHTSHKVFHHTKVVTASLMTETPRAGVHKYEHLTLLSYPHSLGRCFIEYLVCHLHLGKMISASKCAQLVASPLACRLREL